MRTSQEIQAEIENRFGFIPPFFAPALEIAEILENLWQQTLSGYINNPLPALFKEKLFAYLSRYCSLPYCLISHSCTLRPLGMTAKEVLELLESPPPTATQIEEQLKELANISAGIAQDPKRLQSELETESAFAKGVFAGAIFMFLRTNLASVCRREMHRILGPVYYNHVTAFLVYVKSCHTWVENHPELAYEADKRAEENLGGLLREEPSLFDFFRNYSDRIRRESENREEQLLAEINERQRAQQERDRYLEQLQKEREYLEAVVQQMPAGVTIASAPDGRIILCNRQAEELWGSPVPMPQAIAQYNEYQALYPDGSRYKAEDWPMARSLINGEVVKDEEISTIRGDGTPAIVSISSAPIRNSEGRIIAGVVTFSDITEQKQMQQTLRQSEEKLRAQYKNIPIPTYIWQRVESDFVLVDYNYAAVAISKGGIADFVGKTASDLHRDRPEILDELWQCFQEKTPIKREMPYQLISTGESKHLAVSYVYVPPDLVMVYAEDITSRKQAEQQILQANERFTLAAAAVNAVIYDWDVISNQVERTRGIEEILGYSPQEVEPTNKWWRDRIHPGDLERLAQKMQDALANASSFTIEYRIRNKEDRYLYVWDRGIIVRNDRGDAVRVVGCTLDISDRKQAEEELKQQKEILQSILDNIPVMIAFYENSQDIIYVNLEWERAFGWSVEMLKGQGSKDFFAQIAPNPETRKMRYEYMATAQPGWRDFQIAIADGSVQEHSWANIRLSNGMAIGIGVDVTERKRAMDELQASESRFRQLAENLPDVFWMSSPDKSQILYVSPAYEDIWGRSCQSLYEQPKSFLDTIHAEDRDRVAGIFALLIQGESTELEYRIVRPDGEVRWIRDRGFPIKDESGSVYRIAGIAADITSAKQVQEALRQQAEALEQANRIKDEFLAIVSHELRSPLNAILGWAKLLRTRKFDTATTERALETIERNARSQAQLIEDLLDISRILRGKIHLEMRPVELISVIEAAIDTVRFAAEAKSIEFRFSIVDFGLGDIGENLQSIAQFLVSGDTNRLQQVVWNLLSNAIKFTPEGGRVEVRLSVIGNASVQDSGLSYAQIEVSDSGVGIGADFLPYVFERFRQGDSTTTRSQGGLGLGLAIVRQLVDLHGGKVFAASDGVGGGATFTVHLPLLNTAETKISSVKENTSGTDERAASAIRGLRVLVVDDEVDTREWISQALEHYGTEVIAIATAKEVLEVLDRLKADILVSDIGMPVEDGYSLIAKVRSRSSEQGGEIPAIALTAYAREEDRRRSLQAGFQMHMSKPIEPLDLVRAIAKLAGRS